MEYDRCPYCNGCVISHEDYLCCLKCGSELKAISYPEHVRDDHGHAPKSRVRYEERLWRSHKERHNEKNLSEFQLLLGHLQLTPIQKEGCLRQFKMVYETLHNYGVKRIDEPFTILYLLLMKDFRYFIEKAGKLSMKNTEKNWDDIMLALRDGEQLDRSISKLESKFLSRASKARKEVKRIMQSLKLKFLVPAEIDPTIAKANDPNFYRLIEYHFPYHSRIGRDEPPKEYSNFYISPKGKIFRRGVVRQNGRRKPIETWKNRCKTLHTYAYKCFMKFLLELPPDRLSKHRKGLFCACLYLEAEEALDISPKSKNKWGRFFKIDRKTLDKRLREVRSIMPLKQGHSDLKKSFLKDLESLSKGSI